MSGTAHYALARLAERRSPSVTEAANAALDVLDEAPAA